MIKISGNYEEQVGKSTKRAVFDLLFDTPKELRTFWAGNKSILDHPVLHEEEIVALKLTFKEPHKEKIKNLVYRHNTIQNGNQLQVEKREYLDHFSVEAVKAIIYSTDHIPADMEIEEYAAMFLAAYENFGDTQELDKRILNIAGAKTAEEYGLVSEQIRLFKKLMEVFIDELNPEMEDL